MSVCLQWRPEKGLTRELLALLFTSGGQRSIHSYRNAMNNDNCMCKLQLKGPLHHLQIIYISWRNLTLGGNEAFSFVFLTLPVLLLEKVFMWSSWPSSLPAVNVVHDQIRKSRSTRIHAIRSYIPSQEKGKIYLPFFRSPLIQCSDAAPGCYASFTGLKERAYDKCWSLLIRLRHQWLINAHAEVMTKLRASVMSRRMSWLHSIVGRYL